MKRDARRHPLPFALVALLAVVGLGCQAEINPVALDPADYLPAECREAMAAAPAWLFDDLADIFTRLDPADQIRYAQVILAAEDPDYIDELAFSVAHLSPEVLTASDFDETILHDNVAAIYAHAPLLDYVDLVEYGDPLAGGDYYTTTTYRIGDPDRGVTDFELGRDEYYWFVVHPQIEDERPVYIDPETGYAAAPPMGEFWRPYLFNHADEGYPLLSDVLSGVDTLWNQRRSTTTDNGAVGVITRWILDTFEFGSGAERPIQPVRIYAIHLGRCGEHGDITTAASRAALIPCVNISAIGNDHVWNEFYDGAWHQWEPVNAMIDDADSYDTDGDRGWWRMYMAMATRGDGYAWNVTSRYSDTSSLNIAVTDPMGSPVEGAQITIGMRYYIYYIPVFWTMMNPDGTYTVEIGEEKTVYARVDSALGGAGFYRAIEMTEAGATYTWDAVVETEKPSVDVTALPTPAGGASLYRIDVSYDLPFEICYGFSQITGQEFSEHSAPGRALFFICDTPNYQLYQSGQPFQAYEVSHGSSSGEIAFEVPYQASWHVVFSNEEQAGATTTGDAEISLYKNQGGSWTLVQSVTDHLFLPAGSAVAWQAVTFF